MALGSLTIDLLMRTGSFESNSKKAEQRLREMEKTAKVAGAVIGGALAAGVGLLVKNTMDAQREQAQLGAILKSTGMAAGYNLDQLNEMSDRLAKTSAISAGEITEAQTRLLSYSAIAGEQFPRALQLAIDQSVRLGESLTQSAETVGKALEYPAEGVAALTKQGFKFTDEQKKMLKVLEETGRLAEAQAIVMGVMEESYEGAAKAARDTLGGSLIVLKNTFNDLIEGDAGSLKGATDAVNNLTNLLSSDRVKQGFETMITGLVTVAARAAQAATEVANLTRLVAEGVAARIHGAALDDLPNMEREAERIRGSIGRWDARKWRMPDGAMAPGEQAARQRLAVLEKAIADRRQELITGGVTAGLEFQSTSGLRAQFERELAEWGRQGTTKPGTPTGSTGGSKRAAELTEEQKAAAELLRSYEAMNSSLHQQITLHGQSSNAARLNYDLQYGALVNLEPKMRTILEEQAKWLDFLDDMAALDDVWTEIAGEQTQRQIDAMKGPMNEMTVMAEQAARNMQDAFADYLFDPFKDGVGGMLKGFGDMLRRLAAEAAASEIFKALGNYGAQNSGTWWGAMLSVLGGTKKAAGGYIAGPGTATSDSIPALLSNGEYVIKAAAVSQYGRGFFDQLNARRFASGGYVGGTGSAPALMASNSGVKVEVINNGPPVQAQATSERQPDGSQLIRLVLGAVSDDLANGGRTAAALRSRFDVRERV